MLVLKAHHLRLCYSFIALLWFSATVSHLSGICPSSWPGLKTQRCKAPAGHWRQNSLTRGKKRSGSMACWASCCLVGLSEISMWSGSRYWRGCPGTGGEELVSLFHFTLSFCSGLPDYLGAVCSLCIGYTSSWWHRGGCHCQTDHHGQRGQYWGEGKGSDLQDQKWHLHPNRQARLSTRADRWELQKGAAVGPRLFTGNTIWKACDCLKFTDSPSRRLWDNWKHRSTVSHWVMCSVAIMSSLWWLWSCRRQ